MSEEGNVTPQTLNVDTSGSASDMHVPEMNIRGDEDYDISTMIALTEQAEKEEGNFNDGFEGEDSDRDVQVRENAESEDDSEDVEDDFSSEEDDGFDDEASTEDKPARDEITFEVDGKEVKVAENAEVEIRINGKKEKMTLREALNNASGNIHVGREINRVKAREQKLEENIGQFRQQTQQVEANAKALMEIKDPYELCEYICDLKGGDPDQLFNDMLRTTAEYAQKYSQMSPKEIEMERKLRKYEREERHRKAKEEVAKKTQQKEAQNNDLKESLTEAGFEMNDFLSTIDELVEKQRNGEEAGFGLDEIEKPTHDDIIEYMIARDLDNRVSEGIRGLNESLLDDFGFVNRVKKAVIGTELLHGKMDQTEVNSFIKAALNKDNKALSESLRRKANQAESKKVNSREQEDEEGGPQTLDDLYESMRNLGSFR